MVYPMSNKVHIDPDPYNADAPTPWLTLCGTVIDTTGMNRVTYCDAWGGWVGYEPTCEACILLHWKNENE